MKKHDLKQIIRECINEVKIKQETQRLNENVISDLVKSLFSKMKPSPEITDNDRLRYGAKAMARKLVSSYPKKLRDSLKKLESDKTSLRHAEEWDWGNRQHDPDARPESPQAAKNLDMSIEKVMDASIIAHNKTNIKQVSRESLKGKMTPAKFADYSLDRFDKAYEAVVDVYKRVAAGSLDAEKEKILRSELDDAVENQKIKQAIGRIA